MCASSLAFHLTTTTTHPHTHTPTAASYNPLLAVAEGPAFSLWDPRTPHACIAREQPNPPTRLHALASLRLPGGDADPALVVAGDDGVLVVYDLRCLGAGGGKGSRGGGGVGGATTTLRARARWRSAVKHDVVALLAAPSSVLYGAGLDSELLPCVLPPALADGGGGKGKGKKRRLDGEGEAGEGGTGQPPPQPQQQWGQTQASHAPLPATSRLHEVFLFWFSLGRFVSFSITTAFTYTIHHAHTTTKKGPPRLDARGRPLGRRRARPRWYR